MEGVGVAVGGAGLHAVEVVAGLTFLEVAVAEGEVGFDFVGGDSMVFHFGSGGGGMGAVGMCERWLFGCLPG